MAAATANGGRPLCWTRSWGSPPPSTNSSAARPSRPGEARAEENATPDPKRWLTRLSYFETIYYKACSISKSSIWSISWIEAYNIRRREETNVFLVLSVALVPRGGEKEDLPTPGLTYRSPTHRPARFSVAATPEILKGINSWENSIAKLRTNAFLKSKHWKSSNWIHIHWFEPWCWKTCPKYWWLKLAILGPAPER